MTNDLLLLILRANLVAAAAIVLILALRPFVTRRFGPRTTYLLWAVAPLAALASLLPARRVFVDADSLVGVIVTRRTEIPAVETPRIAAAADVATAAIEPGVWLLALWALGAVVSLAILVFRQAAFRRSLGKLTPEGAVWRAEAIGVGPAVVGAVFPRIVIPADFETRFSADQRRVVLAHEEVHFRRGDPTVNGAMALARCLAWFNPAVHVAAHYVRLDQELACDAAVVERFPTGRRSYAEAMLKTQLSPMAGPLACYWPGRSAHPMKQRIALLKQPPAATGRRLLGVAAVAAFGLGAGVVAWAAQPARIETAAPAKAADAPAHPSTPTQQRLGAQLIEAIDEGYPDSIRKLIRSGADVNHFTPGDGTPLIQAARLGDLKTAQMLLAAGADVNKAGSGDGNPLIMAAAHGRIEMAELLVKAGADVNAYVLGDETPLINASRNGDVELVRYLIARGADPNLAVPSGNRPGEMRSPLSMAASREVADLLRAKGARR